MQLEVIDIKGKKTGRQVELPAEIFGATPNDHVIYLAVKQYLAARRSGTHKVKTRAEVQGASRKLHKQKGTGGARKGSAKNPLFRQGGSVFGPRPRAYDIKVNRSTTRLARASALSYKAKENGILLVDALSFDKPKTSEFLNVLKNLSINSRKSLILIPERNDSLYLSSRNIQGANVQIASMVNTYDIMNSHQVVFVGNAHEMVTNILKK